MARTRINGRRSTARGEQRFGVATAMQLQGKELSYNNLNDTDAAYELVAEFDPEASAAVAIIKHANPCGVATGATLAEAYRKALRCDPVSAFGGIVALNRTLDAEAARGDRQDLHRGDHRAGGERRGEGDHRREEESAPAARRRPARPEGAGADLPLARGRLPRAVARQRRGRRARPQGRDQAQADRRRSLPICSSPSPSPSTSSRTPSSMRRTAPRSASAPGR